MKILELRFKNLNSLQGEWLIDFTDPEYSANGIFALTGPTGAGKSTILDAICLALYGKTPRLDKITKSDNDIMSRQTGECYAELLFESQAGRFRCHWSQQCARKNPNGKLQNPKHEIAEGIENGKIIESQLRNVAKVIIEKTGMDFGRFTQSMLLAQGGFDTFLRAEAEQKSKILEQITGTKIYSELSLRVHERNRLEGEKAKNLQATTEGIKVLEPDALQELLASQKQCHQDKTQRQEQSSKASKALDWLRLKHQLQLQINELIEQSKSLTLEKDAFKADQERLNSALNAADLEAQYAPLAALRKQQTADQGDLALEQNKLPTLALSLAEHQKTLQTAEQQHTESKSKQQAAAPLLQQVRSLDQNLKALQDRITENKDLSLQLNTSINTKQQKHQSFQSQINKTSLSLETIEQYLKDNAQDAWLVSGLAGIEQQLKTLLRAKQHILELTKEQQNIKQNIDKVLSLRAHTQTQKNTTQQALTQLSNELTKLKASLTDLLGGRLLREYHDEKEGLLREMVLHNKIAELKEHRARLEDDKPCPLCGSPEHPYALGNTPSRSKVDERIKQLDKLNSRAQKLEQQISAQSDKEKTIQNQFSDIEKAYAIADNDYKNHLTHQTEIDAKIQSQNEQYKLDTMSINATLEKLKVEFNPADPKSTLNQLNIKLQHWQEHQQQKEHLNQQQMNSVSESEKISAIIDNQRKSLLENQAQCLSFEKTHSSSQEDRIALFSDKDPQTEEQKLNQSVTESEYLIKQSRKKHDIALNEHQTTNTRIQSLESQITKRASELTTSEDDFTAQLLKAHFQNEQQFLSKRLSTDERLELKNKAKALEDRSLQLNTQRKDRDDQLAEQNQLRLTDETMDELAPKAAQLEQQLMQTNEQLAKFKHQLAENEQALSTIKDKQKEIDAQNRECQRWKKLHDLIGSADGKKFRNFAQGLTFELMVSHANKQLEKMTDRYLLVRHDENPLELNVIDNYQAGEVRSTKNLSGGESFIVSLTLALGLSKMASRKVRVDSLFLDEGFGTLDEQALETALETLSSLQQNGKLIGIISHVSALKERISTQINVSPLSGGKSQLTGPGCQQL